MEPNIAKKLRRYRRLPVFIEEDHHDVVSHIHRAIGSHHLPMSGVTMVHFDSHPDLLLPLNMDADLVFNKEDLYSSLSIENWILPLVYAGHVSEIYWLRPPWAHQLPAGDLTFGVGKCKDTGKLRMTCPDPYFLTEALYTPESQLLQMKETTVHVITITPDNWDCCNLRDSKSDSTGTFTSPEANVNGSLSCENKSSDSASQTSVMPYEAAASRKENSADVQGNSNNVVELRKEAFTAPVACVDGKRKACPEDSVSKSNSCAETAVSHICPGSKLRKTEQGDTHENARSQQEPGDFVIKTFSVEPEGCDEALTRFPEQWKWLGDLRDKLCGKAYVLDIDLDFFSTKDPFRDGCTPEQTALLRELFGYQLPKEASVQALVDFTAARRAQLEELEKAFEELQKDPSRTPCILHPHRQEVFEKLINSFQSSSQMTTVDYEIIYQAGCTMDDTELPHHVSSSAQIQQLMAASRYVLDALPPPTIVTIARSSEDDYCPKDQVDTIEEAMLDVLTKINPGMDIQKMYKQTSNSDEKS
ncbi:hypothetical protein BaRGS_00014955 [Batillaria attramentaria]|uniref:Uncharacterized protein n=1 Tax=Batillaria attramentaria TaxID=370345 RepID=A0ABD0L2Q8_9CAEN